MSKRNKHGERREELFVFEKIDKAPLPSATTLYNVMKKKDTTRTRILSVELSKYFVRSLAKRLLEDEVACHDNGMESFVKDTLTKAVAFEDAKKRGDVMEMIRDHVTPDSQFKDVVIASALWAKELGMAQYDHVFEDREVMARVTNALRSGKVTDRILPELNYKDERKCLMSFQILNSLQDAFFASRRDVGTLAYASVLSKLKSPYIEKGFYSIAGDFFNDFVNVDMKKLRFSHLPADLAGTVRLPRTLTDPKHHYCFDEFIFHSGPGPYYSKEAWEIYRSKDIEEGFEFDESLPTSAKHLTFAWMDKKPSKEGYSYFKLVERYPGQTLEEAWKESSKNAEKDIREKGGLGVALKDDCYIGLKKLLINTLVYINSGNPDLRPFKNRIRYDSVTGKPKSQFQSLTEKEIQIVGYGWKKLPKYQKDSWYSSPHMGWRRCGKNWSEVKLCFIKGSMKKRKSLADQVENTDYEEINYNKGGVK